MIPVPYLIMVLIKVIDREVFCAIRLYPVKNLLYEENESDIMSAKVMSRIKSGDEIGTVQITRIVS